MTNTKWHMWSDRNKIANKNQPAVYFIAYSEENISDKDFSFIKEIIYIGMSISNNGLKGRLDQFEDAMKGKDGVHGGAERVRLKYKNSEEFFKKAYFSAMIYKLSDKRDSSDDWRTKGDCVGHEYKSFADYMDIFNCLPEFNDQKRSKKK